MTERFFQTKKAARLMWQHHHCDDGFLQSLKAQSLSFLPSKAINLDYQTEIPLTPADSSTDKLVAVELTFNGLGCVSQVIFVNYRQ